MTNKEASTSQENMVANYMGWRVVTGSGSRPFRPGDVQNDHFLVECKTHTEPQEKIIFYTKHWAKISEEAQAKHRYPALVVDNGTQKSQNTWVMLSRSVIPDDRAFRHFNIPNTSTSGNTITFNHSAVSNRFKLGHQLDRINFFPEWCNNEQIAIMPLEEFKKFYVEQFES